MKYQLDDVITTKDGRTHRVLWGTKNVNGEQLVLLVKRLDDPKKGEKHKVKTCSIVKQVRNGEELTC